MRLNEVKPESFFAYLANHVEVDEFSCCAFTTVHITSSVARLNQIEIHHMFFFLSSFSFLSFDLPKRKG